MNSLEPGAQLALHAIRRASLHDGTSCPVNTPKVINAQLAMRNLANILFAAGRPLKLGEIGALDPMPDERTLLNVMAAAQNNNNDAFIAALRWLVGYEPDANIIDAGRAAASAFAEVGWRWGAPEIKRAPEPPFGMKPVRPVD